MLELKVFDNCRSIPNMDRPMALIQGSARCLKPGIDFCDITAMLKDLARLKAAIDGLLKYVSE